MDNKTQRKLRLLDNMIGECKECPLYHNGRAKPYWTDKSSYVIVGEAPGKTEIEENEPFIGTAGKILWDIMEKNGFKKEQFLIINAINCRPVDGNRNGKPTQEQMEICHKWVMRYINVLLPLRGILLGAYAQRSLLKEDNSVTKCNATAAPLIVENFNSPFVPVIRSVHPAYALYNEEGKRLLEESILKFKME